MLPPVIDNICTTHPKLLQSQRHLKSSMIVSQHCYTVIRCSDGGSLGISDGRCPPKAASASTGFGRVVSHPHTSCWTRSVLRRSQWAVCSLRFSVQSPLLWVRDQSFRFLGNTTADAPSLKMEIAPSVTPAPIPALAPVLSPSLLEHLFEFDIGVDICAVVSLGDRGGVVEVEVADMRLAMTMATKPYC